MIINLSFDQGDSELPPLFKSVVNAVGDFFESLYSDPITINIAVGYGEVHGQSLSSGAIGETIHPTVASSYTAVRDALIADATTADDLLAVSTIPSSDPTGGFPWRIPRANAKALGLLNATSSQIDGYIGFSTTTPFDYTRSNGISSGTYDFFAVVAHELAHAMGRTFGSGEFYPYELFHFASPGVLQQSGSEFGYFSINNGVTNLATFNDADNGGTPSDWASSVSQDAFRAFAQSGVVLQVSEVDLKVMDVLGYDRIVASPPPPPAAPAGPGDFNGDGKGDFLFQIDIGRAAIWLLNGTQLLFGDLVGPSPGPSWHIRGTGDFNADGKADILWQTDSGIAAIWEMNGTQVIFGDTCGPNPGPTWHIVGSGDFNADGKSDILWQTDTGQAAVWEMNGTQVIFGDLAGPNPGTAWHVRATGDFNGDSKSDILWQTDSGQAAIWLMNGAQVLYGDIVGPNPGPTWHVRSSGDFNGDGKADILWQTDAGQAAIWLMNGTQLLFGDVVGPNPGSTWQIKGAEDLNGDGKADVLWQTNTGQPAAWLMNGTQVAFGDIVGPNPGTNWQLVAATA